MKYFIVEIERIKTYIAAFSEESILKEIERKISYKGSLDECIELSTSIIPIKGMVRFLQRHPGDKSTIVFSRLKENKIEYGILDIKKIKITEDDSLSSELFFPQEEVFKSLITHPLDYIFEPTRWMQEINIPSSEFITQVGTLMGQGLLKPLYKLNTTTLTSNEWTSDLSSLGKVFQTKEGAVDGRNPQNILIAFQRIA